MRAALLLQTRALAFDGMEKLAVGDTAIVAER